MVLKGSIELSKENFELKADFNFCFSEGIWGILGPSASGKTTFLRTIAGFENEARGKLLFGDQIWLGKEELSVSKRRIGYLSQHNSLFPHLSVEENLIYARQRALDHKISFEEVNDSLSLTHLLKKNVGALSGGEVQRVSLGRALLSSPQMLLLDEPLSALDEIGKKELMEYLKRTFLDFRIPSLYVTHSLSEIAYFTDQIVLMEAGKISKKGSLLELVDQPYFQSILQKNKELWDNLTKKISPS